MHKNTATVENFSSILSQSPCHMCWTNFLRCAFRRFHEEIPLEEMCSNGHRSVSCCFMRTQQEKKEKFSDAKPVADCDTPSGYGTDLLEGHESLHEDASFLPKICGYLETSCPCDGSTRFIPCSPSVISPLVKLWSTIINNMHVCASPCIRDYVEATRFCFVLRRNVHRFN